MQRNGNKSGKQSVTREVVPGILQPGAVAPEFSLHATPDQKVGLHELRGQAVILAFYPADWSPVCGDQLALYNEVLPEFHRYSAQLIGISVDGVWCHRAYAENHKLKFTLLSDFEPKGAVSAAYGVYDGVVGECQRALFVIDGKGVIQWSHLSPVGINPGADGILSALEDLRAGERRSQTDKEITHDHESRSRTSPSHASRR